MQPATPLRTRARALTLGAVLAVGACASTPAPTEPTRAPVAKEEATRPWSASDGKVTLHLPASWEVEPQAPSGREVLALWATVPEARSRIGVYVYAMTASVSPRGRLVFERAAALRHYEAQDCETHLDDVVPWCVVDDLRKPDAPWRRAYATTMVRGNTILVRAFVRPDAWRHVERALVEATRTVETTLPDWPERPEGLREVAAGSRTYLLSPRVRDEDVASLDAFLREREAIFVSRNGHVPRTASVPLHVLVYGPDEGAPAPLWTRTAFGWIDRRQLWARPLPPDAERRAKVAAEWETLLWTRTWSEALPWWIHESCGILAESEAAVGAPLPAASEALAASWPKSIAPLADVVRWTPAEIYDGHVPDVVAWLAVFRAGPPEARAAWDACVEEALASGDWERAQRHLLAIDAERLRRAALELGASLDVRRSR